MVDKRHCLVMVLAVAVGAADALAVGGERPGKGEPGARETFRRVLNYFVKTRSRMRYSEIRAKKLAIGSGVVEAANKTLAAGRMKRSGMRWHIKSEQAIQGFRALQKSGFFASA